ncbi:outer membrane protein assembly factor BamD [Urechidicola croceus]|uniref:Outer membrane protein assembly factor BamD n=2 Tax=Urechidicola croceus TaxID=1850246 RepID=A0A1D8PBJ5_9FLAO|nr:outer membrane protein assembly factor BamD [Urechidicola croceus]
MKRIGYIFLIAIALSSCSQYQKVLNKGTVEEQYKMATDMYDAQKYGKAIQLFEKITPSYRGKPQMERIQYMVSDAYYQTKQYSLASYYFDRFTKNYPKSTKREEAAYLSAMSYYLDSPVFSLDQTSTHEALTAMQSFIDQYPESEKIADANIAIKELRHKLEKKAFETAKQYYHIEDYTASITSFDNLISDYLGTSFREEAMFYKLKASYELGMNSIAIKKEKRLKDAIKAYDRLKRNYPASEYINDADKLLKDLNNELATFTNTVATSANK